ncbi:MAG: hypothetical protein NXI10_16155 [bacterium]|nr:hypothetical protein [bacterium]
MEGYKELLDQLNGLVTALEKGELSLDELNELESVTRSLHERSIILRYKAFESSVLNETEKQEEEEVSEEPVAVIEPEEETPQEEPAAEEPESEEEEEPAFDFAIFDEHEETPGTQSVDIEEETRAKAEAETVEATPIEPETVEEVKAEIDPVSPPEAVDEVKLEEEEIPPVPAPKPASSSGSSFMDRFEQQDNSVAGRFSAGPLDSLIGAFGLNERLRFINDLFDGSSEKFSDAIKALDSQSDIEAAKAKVAGYAEENEWDPEEEVVAEFMNYLNRRYA